MKTFYDETYALAAHSFDTTRKAAWVAEALRADPVAGVEVLAPAPLAEADLLLAHDAAYVEAVRTGEPLSLAQSQGFRWDPGLFAMVRASNGGAVAAAREALAGARAAGSLSSGLHHARRECGLGFCTFNGLAIAARVALREGARSVLVLDLDAHCGGGTHSLVRDEPRITHLDVSTDAFDRYAPEGESTLDLIEDAARYLPAVEARLAALGRFDLCLYNAGMDPFERCPIGGLAGITREVLARREALVFEWCRAAETPVAFVLAGGYIDRHDPARFDRQALAGLHRLTVEAAARSSRA